MLDLTELSDDDLRAALFDALVERLDVKAFEDTSIAVVNRMPTAFAVSRRGNLLTLSQGIGVRLLRGDLRWRDRRERLHTFNVDRATIQSRLVITPDSIEGTPDEILDRIVAMFLLWTATGDESQPAVAEPIQEGRPTARVQQNRPTIREVLQERRATSPGSMEEGRPATSRAESPPAPGEITRPTSAGVTEEGPPRPQIKDTPSEAEASAPPRPAPIREKTATLRTYQMLFETAQRQLEVAKAVSAGSSRYYLVSAGVFVAMTAEAFFNDLGSRVITSWGQLQRLDPREKAEVLNIELFNDKVDWSVRPFQSVAAALGFRRALAHAHAETLSVDQVGTADRKDTEVPRTRRTAWQEHCDVVTIQLWITDVRLLIEHFSRGHDPTDVAV